MKNRIKILLSFFVLLAGLSWQGCDTAGDFDQPDVDYFVKYYGTSLGNQTGVDMVVNADGSITMVGTSQIGSIFRTYFVKVDAVGNVLTEKYLSGPSDRVKDIEPIGDDYLILSEFTLEGTENVDVKIIRVTADGVRVDSVSTGTFAGLGEPLNDYPKEIRIFEDLGKILVSGYSDNIEDNATANPDFGDFLVLAFEASPGLVEIDWNNRPVDYDADDLDVVTTSVEAKMSGNRDILCAIGFSSTTAGSLGDRQLFYFEMSPADGQLGASATAAHVPAGSDIELFDAIDIRTTNGGFFFVGNIRTGNGRAELFFGKLRETLTFLPTQDVQLLDKVLPEGATNFSGVSACKSSFAPEGYLIAGVDTKPTGSTDNWVVKIDLSGRLVWSSKFGSDQGDDTASKIVELPDGKIVVVGTTELGDNQTKLSLIKMNSSGQLLK